MRATQSKNNLKITTQRKIRLLGREKGKPYYTAKVREGNKLIAEFIPDDGTKETALEMARDYVKGNRA